AQQRVKVVGLQRVVHGRLVAPLGAAAGAAVNDDPALLAAVLGAGRDQQAAAVAGTVARVDVHMHRVQATGAVVAVGAVGQGGHLSTAVQALEPLVAADGD